MNDSTIISTRLRLARNVAGLPFPHKLAEAPARQITENVANALRPLDKFTRYDMSNISELESNVLRERHLISSDLVSECPFGSVLISSDENVSVMTNEEDHIREQVIMPGFSLDRAYERVNNIDDVLSQSVKFAFDARFGYLTSCATNLGTGMRASVMMFLPALTINNMIESCINEIGRLNMTVRGVYGEGSKAEGYLYQISNCHTLGVKESDIIDSVKIAINRIEEAELRARDMLRRNEGELKDKILRAFGIVTNAYKLSTAETMQLLAMVRLGGYYGYFNISDDIEFQNLITECQPANIQSRCGAEGANARDVVRAKHVAITLDKICNKNL